MQIEAFNSACVSKQEVLSSATKETTSATTNTKESNSSGSSSSSSHAWLDEAYQLVFGNTSSDGALGDVDWNKWSRSSSSNSSKTKLPYGTTVDFSKWSNITLTNGTSFSDLPQDAFFGSYEDFLVAIYSIF